jgi:hypothetical protein
LIEIDSEDSATVFNKVINRLEQFGLTKDVLKRRLVCVTTDGASVMTGANSGVATRFQKEFGPVSVFHCYAHRLELCVNAAKNADLGVGKVIGAAKAL